MQFEWFLREVACIPLTVGDIAGIGRREYDRAVWLELLHGTRSRALAQPPLPADAKLQAWQVARSEEDVRRFYTERGILTQPRWLRRYLVAPMPDYLEPLRFLGMANDLTGPDRLTEDAVSYFPPPRAELPYFYAANARDPRAGIVHEGALTISSWRWPGATRVQSGGITTTPPPTKASRSTTRK